MNCTKSMPLAQRAVQRVEVNEGFGCERVGNMGQFFWQVINQHRGSMQCSCWLGFLPFHRLLNAFLREGEDCCIQTSSIIQQYCTRSWPCLIDSRRSRACLEVQHIVKVLHYSCFKVQVPSTWAVTFARTECVCGSGMPAMHHPSATTARA